MVRRLLVVFFAHMYRVVGEATIERFIPRPKYVSIFCRIVSYERYRGFRKEIFSPRDKEINEYVGGLVRDRLRIASFDPV